MSSNHQDKSNDGTIIILKVAEANSRDVGRRIGRGDPKVASEMASSTGDAIEISAGKNKKTTVLHWPAYQKDYGRGLIRIDGYTRNKKERHN
jgi:transitional endoplasmic reticulum ATPase